MKTLFEKFARCVIGFRYAMFGLTPPLPHSQPLMPRSKLTVPVTSVKVLTTKDRHFCKVTKDQRPNSTINSKQNTWAPEEKLIGHLLSISPVKVHFCPLITCQFFSFLFLTLQKATCLTIINHLPLIFYRKWEDGVEVTWTWLIDLVLCKLVS